MIANPYPNVLNPTVLARVLAQSAAVPAANIAALHALLTSAPYAGLTPAQALRKANTPNDANPPVSTTPRKTCSPDELSKFLLPCAAKAATMGAAIQQKYALLISMTTPLLQMQNSIDLTSDVVQEVIGGLVADGILTQPAVDKFLAPSTPQSDGAVAVGVPLALLELADIAAGLAYTAPATPAPATGA